MVAPKQENTIGILNLETEEQRHSFDRIVSPIDKVANHDELILRDASAYLEHLLHIKELPMDIPSNLDRRIDNDNIGLVDEHTLDHVAERAHGRLGDRLAIPGLLQPFV